MLDPELGDCTRYPLHRIAAIQPHGYLLLFNRRAHCLAGSSNWPRDLGRSMAEMLGDNPSWAAPLRGLLARLESEPKDGRYLSEQVEIGGRVLWCQGHRAGEHLILELEPSHPGLPQGTGAPSPSAHQLTDCLSYVHRIKQCQTQEACAKALLHLVASQAGYGRAMLYRFLPKWHGEVIAEHLVEGMSSYLNHRFPAEDIPPNARELYRANPLRMIADIDAEPMELLGPALDPPPDFTWTRLRAVHPAHLTYLANMAVQASFSLSLVVNGRLWGLIACHHTTPKILPISIRRDLEVCLSITAMRMSGLAERAADRFHYQVEGEFLQLRKETASLQRQDLSDLAFRKLESLLDLFQVDGCIMRIRGRLHRSGQCLPGAVETRLLEWLTKHSLGDCDGFDELPAPLRDDADLRRYASGAFFLRLPKQDFVLLLRKEYIESIVWAGRPHPPPSEAADLSPRRSFERWVEITAYTSRPWSDEVVTGIRQLRIELSEWLVAAHHTGLAFTDTLTGLANRARLQEYLFDKVNHCRHESTCFALCFLDLDGFKQVNDNFGHDVGDEVLRVVARRLTAILRDDDLLARPGGDEFIIVQSGTLDTEGTLSVIRRIRHSLEPPILIAGQRMPISASVGAALFPDDASSIDELIKVADQRMYDVKLSSPEHR